jgi:hypothetical protein
MILPIELNVEVHENRRLAFSSILLERDTYQTSADVTARIPSCNLDLDLLRDEAARRVSTRLMLEQATMVKVQRIPSLLFIKLDAYLFDENFFHFIQHESQDRFTNLRSIYVGHFSAPSSLR